MYIITTTGNLNCLYKCDINKYRNSISPHHIFTTYEERKARQSAAAIYTSRKNIKNRKGNVGVPDSWLILTLVCRIHQTLTEPISHRTSCQLSCWLFVLSPIKRIHFLLSLFPPLRYNYKSDVLFLCLV